MENEDKVTKRGAHVFSFYCYLIVAQKIYAKYLQRLVR